jgi:hypothetical protein
VSLKRTCCPYCHARLKRRTKVTEFAFALCQDPRCRGYARLDYNYPWKIAEVLAAERPNPGGPSS